MNAHQRRKKFRVAQQAVREHNRQARILTEQDPGMLKRWAILKEWIADRKAKGLGKATQAECDAIRDRMLEIPLTPDPERKRWIRGVIRSRKPVKRTLQVCQPPSRKTGYEGELIAYDIDKDGKTTETGRRPLKGLIA